MKINQLFKSTLILASTVILALLVTSFKKEKEAIQYKQYNLQNSLIYTLSISKNNEYKIKLGISNQLDYLERFVQNNKTQALINAGFFDPKNQKTTSYLVQNGKLIGDPKENERLINNPDLQAYLKQILNRSEWRQYQCKGIVKYTIAFHQDPIPSECQLIHSVGGGPRLLPTLTAEKEGFVTYQNGQIVRDALGYNRRNARTAIAITQEGDLLWVMVAQKSEKPSDSGMSLPELADFLKGLGVTEALNLDGGSSSALYYQGKTFYGKVDKEGKTVKRPVKSVLILQK